MNTKGLKSKNFGYPTKSLDSAGVNLLDCVHKTPKPVSSGYPYIAIPNIKSGRLDLKDVRLISEENYKEWTKKTIPRAGDIILTRRARVGDIAVIPEGLKCAIGQNLVILRSDEKQVLQRYLKWALRGPLYEQEMYKYLNVGAVFDSLNCKDIPKFKIPLPTISEQNAISDILDSLDDKIDLNNQMNKTLEQIAQTLFKHWFIDFEFPDENGNPYKSSGGRMVDSELGEIPKGWKVKKIEDIAAINESSIKKDYSYDEINYVDISSVDNGKLIETTKYKTETAPSRAKRIVKNGDTIWSMVRPNRRSYLLILNPQENIVVSTGFAVISPKVVPYSYLYFWVTTDSFVNYLSVSADGSAYPAVTAERFKEAKVLVPDQNILTKFEKFASSLLFKINCNSLESLNLAKIRDSLLPKLMSGKIRVEC